MMEMRRRLITCWRDQYPCQIRKVKWNPMNRLLFKIIFFGEHFLVKDLPYFLTLHLGIILKAVQIITLYCFTLEEVVHQKSGGKLDCLGQSNLPLSFVCSKPPSRSHDV